MSWRISTSSSDNPLGEKGVKSLIWPVLQEDPHSNLARLANPLICQVNCSSFLPCTRSMHFHTYTLFPNSNNSIKAIFPNPLTACRWSIGIFECQHFPWLHVSSFSQARNSIPSALLLFRGCSSTESDFNSPVPLPSLLLLGTFRITVLKICGVISFTRLGSILLTCNNPRIWKRSHCFLLGHEALSKERRRISKQTLSFSPERLARWDLELLPKLFSFPVSALPPPPLNSALSH